MIWRYKRCVKCDPFHFQHKQIILSLSCIRGINSVPFFILLSVGSWKLDGVPRIQNSFQWLFCSRHCLSLNVLDKEVKNKRSQEDSKVNVVLKLFLQLCWIVFGSFCSVLCVFRKSFLRFLVIDLSNSIRRSGSGVLHYDEFKRNDSLFINRH